MLKIKLNPFFLTTTIKFPHIFRRFSVPPLSFKTKPVLAIFLLFLIGINLIVKLGQRSSQQELFINKILRDPFNSNLHRLLAQDYMAKNIAASEAEFILAEEYFNDEFSNLNVLGRQSPIQLYLKQKEEKTEIEVQIKYWQEIQRVYPDYYYALLMQAVLNHKIGKTDVSKRLFEEILEKKPEDSRILQIYQEF